MKYSAWILAARPRTLPAAAVPVMIGTAIAASLGTFQALPAILCLVFALLIQVGTNYANDYFDFIQGADNPERIGPSRAVASGWISPLAMRNGMIAVFTVAFCAGLTLTWWGGAWLVIIGIASVGCGIAYTGGPYPLGYNGWGEVFVFFFFGFVATGLTYYVQSGTFTLVGHEEAASWFRTGGVWLAGLLPGALSSNLLVVNNYRDAPLDAQVGKRTLAVRFGRKFAGWEYDAGSAMLGLVPVIFFIGGYNAWILLPALLIPRSVYLSYCLRSADSRESFGWLLAETAKILIFAGILFSLGLMAGA